MKILVATTNPGKVQEITDILAAAGVDVVTPKELGITITVSEDGNTFEENAVRKAEAFRDVSGLPALADDSGLCVDALFGAPGVLSARFAGLIARDEDNIALLLKTMRGMKDRNARFVCVAALALVNGEVITARGEYHGMILEKPQGTGGFGYDPVFLDPVTGKTFAELSLEEKNRISHRKKALVALRDKLSSLGYLPAPDNPGGVFPGPEGSVKR